jgi:hypothetical protein
VVDTGAPKYVAIFNQTAPANRADFVEKDMENVVQLFRVFNDGTHGSSGRFEYIQLVAIRARVQGAVSFLRGIITGDTFAAS